MYNKKYILEKIEEFNGHNYIYDNMEGCVCYPAYFNVGERGWFLIEPAFSFDTVHRIHTSVVKSVNYYQNAQLSSDYIAVETQNTRYIFRLI